MSQETWDSFWMGMSCFVAEKSKDKHSHLGAVIVGRSNELVSIGYNGFPRRVIDDNRVPERYERPLKYYYTVHAESNAIYYAARNGVALDSLLLYTQVIPCSECAKAIIQAGICKVVYSKDLSDMFTNCNNPHKREDWLKSCDISLTMFNEAGVCVRAYDGPILMPSGFLVNSNRISFDENRRNEYSERKCSSKRQFRAVSSCCGVLSSFAKWLGIRPKSS